MSARSPAAVGRGGRAAAWLREAVEHAAPAVVAGRSAVGLRSDDRRRPVSAGSAGGRSAVGWSSGGPAAGGVWAWRSGGGRAAVGGRVAVGRQVAAACPFGRRSGGWGGRSGGRAVACSGFAPRSIPRTRARPTCRPEQLAAHLVVEFSPPAPTAGLPLAAGLKMPRGCGGCSPEATSGVEE